jgi:serine/threonine protein kinase
MQPVVDVWNMPVIESKDITLGSIVLGTGGSGKVVRAQYERRVIAVKCPRPETADIRNFLSEAQIMNQVKHPNIVQFIGITLINENVCILMERVKWTLQDLSVEDYPKQILIAQEVCSALSYLHEVRIFHRAVRSANVLISRDYHAKLADFGSSVIGADHTEEVKGRSRIAKICDLYKLGILLFEIACNLRLEIVTKDIEELQVKITQIRECGAEVPQIFSDAMERCWDQKPIQEVEEALSR